MNVEALLAAAGARALEHASIGPLTTYRVGGRVRVLVTLSTRDDLEDLSGPLAELAGSVLALGKGSNLLVADGEHDVVVVRLSGEFEDVTWYDDERGVALRAGAGADLPVTARRLVADGVVGFEWAVGVPGSFGGAVAMNAGGHGSDMSASLWSADVWRAGTVRSWSLEELALGYRTSAIVPGDLVLAAEVRLARGDADAARARLSDVVRWRRAHQPGGANAGSVFRNPPGDHAARLVEAAGLRGERLGGARVSEKHANFVQADAGASARDVYDLIESVRARVLERTGVALVCENRFLGFETGR